MSTKGDVPFNLFQRDPAFDILDERDKFIERGEILENKYQDFLNNIDSIYGGLTVLISNFFRKICSKKYV